MLVEIFNEGLFLLPQGCTLLAHGCQDWDINLKFKMGGHIDTILMWVKFGDDPISSLDFSFIGGCTLKSAYDEVIFQYIA